MVFRKILKTLFIEVIVLKQNLNKSIQAYEKEKEGKLFMQLDV